jgi:sucrose-6-phosphate hydrolase SacC (GH32 family)
LKGEKAGKNDFQTQGIAYSLDKGRTWTKYADNPVIQNPHLRDFRDPKVIWHEASKQWIMTLAVGNYVVFYASKNLKNWAQVGEFGQKEGAHDVVTGGVWECPDLFPVTQNLHNLEHFKPAICFLLHCVFRNESLNDLDTPQALRPCNSRTGFSFCSDFK